MTAPTAQMTNLLSRYGVTTRRNLLAAIAKEYREETGEAFSRAAVEVMLDEMLDAERERIEGGAYDVVEDAGPYDPDLQPTGCNCTISRVYGGDCEHTAPEMQPGFYADDAEGRPIDGETIAEYAEGLNEEEIPMTDSTDYAARVRAFEAEGMTTSDAQAAVDAEDLPTPERRAYAEGIRPLGDALLTNALDKAERREIRKGGTDKAWVVDALRAELDERCSTVTADEILAALAKVTDARAEVAQTGGGVATIYLHDVVDGSRAVAIGSGSYDWQMPGASRFGFEDLVVAADSDDGNHEEEWWDVRSMGEIVKKAVVMLAVQQGMIDLEGVARFAELHDYLDANTLGGLCDARPWVSTATDGDALDEAWHDAAEEVQQHLDEWISDGRAMTAVTGAVDGPQHSDACIEGGQSGCIPGCPGLKQGGFPSEDAPWGPPASPLNDALAELAAAYDDGDPDRCAAAVQGVLDARKAAGQ
jgi:hypothetical protein